MTRASSSGTLVLFGVSPQPTCRGMSVHVMNFILTELFWHHLEAGPLQLCRAWPRPTSVCSVSVQWLFKQDGNLEASHRSVLPSSWSLRRVAAVLLSVRASYVLPVAVCLPSACLRSKFALAHAFRRTHVNTCVTGNSISS